jgi:hypothetical protein
LRKALLLSIFLHALLLAGLHRPLMFNMASAPTPATPIKLRWLNDERLTSTPPHTDKTTGRSDSAALTRLSLERAESAQVPAGRKGIPKQAPVNTTDHRRSGGIPRQQTEPASAPEDADVLQVLDPAAMRAFRIALALSGAQAIPPVGTPSGAATLRLRFAMGLLVAVDLFSASGDPNLDAWLIQRFKQGAQNTPLPLTLRRGNFEVLLPIEWRDE